MRRASQSGLPPFFPFSNAANAVRWGSVINSDGKLSEFLPALRAAQWVALDTEADSLHAYPEKLCLIQISTASGDRLVDPLAPHGFDRALAGLEKAPSHPARGRLRLAPAAQKQGLRPGPHLRHHAGQPLAGGAGVRAGQPASSSTWGWRWKKARKRPIGHGAP